MIDPDRRFWIDIASDDFVQRETHLIDWDQRRAYTIIGPSRSWDDDEDLEVELLKRHINQLDDDVHALHVDGEGSLVSTLSSPEDDESYTAYFPDILDCPSLHDNQTVLFSELKELDRLGVMVDLVTYTDAHGTEKKVVFKYALVSKRMNFTWREIHFIKSLPDHPNLLPIDRVVLDDEGKQVLGFTVPYIPGESLEYMENKTFTLRHLEQLTDVVDLLNLQFGIAHQDIMPQNLLVHRDNIILFDFEKAADIGPELGNPPECNDVKGVVFTLYQIITGDKSFWRMHPTEQKEEDVLDMETWPQNCRLDGEVAQFRQHLHIWIKRRRETDSIAPAKVNESKIPEMPNPRPIIEGDDETGEPTRQIQFIQRRNDALKYGNHMVNWRRAP